MTIVPPSPKAAALVLAPQGRDAAIASGLLGEIGIRCRVCSNVADLGQELNDNVSFVIVSEEALRAPIVVGENALKGPTGYLGYAPEAQKR